MSVGFHLQSWIERAMIATAVRKETEKGQKLEEEELDDLEEE